MIANSVRSVESCVDRQLNSRNKIVIIDDDKSLAEAIAWAVDEAGYEPFLIVEGSFNKVDDLISEFPEDTYGVLCDHRLNKSGLASFHGSDLVANLYDRKIHDRKIPALLQTQFYDIDSDVSIRKHRHKIPVLLDRNNVEASTIKEGIRICLQEFNGTIESNRRPHRNIMWIVDIDEKSGEKVVDVIIPGWNPHKAVRLPVSLINEWILDFQPAIDTYLIANVNNGAENYEDLYFTNFEIAPEPEEIDDHC